MWFIVIAHLHIVQISPLKSTAATSETAPQGKTKPLSTENHQGLILRAVFHINVLLLTAQLCFFVNHTVPLISSLT